MFNVVKLVTLLPVSGRRLDLRTKYRPWSIIQPLSADDLITRIHSSHVGQALI